MRSRSFLLAVLLATVSTVAFTISGAWAYDVIDSNDYLQDFMGSASGACPVQLEHCSTSFFSSCKTPTSGVWPSSGSCPQIDDGDPLDIGGNRKRTVEPTSTNQPFIANERAVAYAYTNRGVLTTSIPATLWNKQDVAAPVPIFSFGWCGEQISAEFDKNTLTPRDVRLAADSDNKECWDRTDAAYASNPDFYRSVTGIPSGSAQEAFYTTRTVTTGLAQAYTMPVPLSCNNYTIRITDRSFGDWVSVGDKGVMANFSNANGQEHVYKWTLSGRSTPQQGDNWLTVRLDTNTQNQVTKITVDSGDGSSAAGGVAFTVYCNGVREPDENRAVCDANTNWQWNQGVFDNTNPSRACCGDDAGDANTLASDGTTMRQCVADANGKHTWSNVVTQYAGGTCNAANEGKIYADANDAALCFNNSNTFHFAFASSDTSVRMLPRGGAVSNSTAWLLCGDTTSATPMDPIIGGVGSGAPGTAALCTSVTNGQGPTYTCQEQWTSSSASLVTFSAVPNSNPQRYAKATTNNAAIYYQCKNNALVQAQAKWSPERTQSGACPANSCYYPGASLFTTSDCVPSGKWVRDNYCLGETWTTRTRLLADDMLKTFPGASIVHCDSADEALNKPKVPSAFASLQPTPRINSVCVAQENTANGAVYVGATLNNVAGRNFGDSYDEASDQEAITIETTLTSIGKLSIAGAINGTRVQVLNKKCDEANSWSENDEYIACPASAGQILYNTDTDTVVLTSSNAPFVNAPTSEQVAAQRFATVQQPTMPLSGYKVYSYKNANTPQKSIDAVLQKEGTGTAAKYQATVVYKGFNPTRHVQARLTNPQRVTITPAGADWVVTLTTPTQSEWEYLTLQLRP